MKLAPKQHIGFLIADFCARLEIKYKSEYKFSETRKFRFDWAIIDKKIAVEYEGIYNAAKSRHTTVGGYTTDSTKYNLAVIEGWKVLRYTAKNYTNIYDDLEKLLVNKKLPDARIYQGIKLK